MPVRCPGSVPGVHLCLYLGAITQPRPAMGPYPTLTGA